MYIKLGFLFSVHRIWPDFVKERVRTTYMYFAGGLGVTAATAVAVSRNAAIMNMMTKNSFLVCLC